MKTIFDTLNLPQLREQPALYLGEQDLRSLEVWIYGYVAACMDAGEEERLNTPNGIPISLLRDYLAWKEQDESTGGIAYIMRSAANHSEEEAWKRFFSHLDAFEALTKQDAWYIKVTGQRTDAT